jgi:hypothetical protein
LIELEDEASKAVAETEAAIKAGEGPPEEAPDRSKSLRKSQAGCDAMLPATPLHEARQTMTWPNFIQRHDHLIKFSIDSHT